MDNDLFAAASQLVHRVVGSEGYGLAYGSHARGTAGPRSDLDLLVVGKAGLDQDALSLLVNEVKRLHHRHGLELDEEVSYDVKLYASAADIAAATAFEGYTVSPSGDLRIPRLVASPDFLNSNQFKLRLVINALTGPHIFLGGDADRFIIDQVRACRSVALLALSALDWCDTVSMPDVIDALVNNRETGATGQDFLGYTAADTGTLYGLAQRGFAYLMAKGALRPLDGVTFEHRHSVRRSLVLMAAARLPRSVPEIPDVISVPDR